MLHSIYHMTLNILVSKRQDLPLFYATFPENLKTTSSLSILLHVVISLPDATSCDK